MNPIHGPRSQLNNLLRFRRLFPLRSVVRNTLTLPLDYAGPSARCGPPMVVNVMTTSRCNQRCSMCWAEEARRRPVREMTPGQLDRIAAATLGWRPTFFLTGGEPFARDDVADLMQAVKRHGLPLGVITNGLGVTPERGEQAKALGLESIVFSLHGTEAVHDRVTRVPGAYRKALAHIEAFCRGPRRTQAMLNVVLSAANLGSLVELAETGKRLGVDHVRVEHLLFMTDGDVARHAAWCEARLPEDERRTWAASTFFCGPEAYDGMSGDLVQSLAEVRERFPGFVSIKPFLTPSEIPEWYSDGYVNRRRCFFIWRSLFLDPEGSVFPCQHYPEMRFGNALKEPLLEVWNSPRYRRFRRVIREGILPGCARCTKL